MANKRQRFLQRKRDIQDYRDKGLTLDEIAKIEGVSEAENMADFKDRIELSTFHPLTRLIVGNSIKVL